MKKEQLPTLENEENNESIIEQDPMKDPQYSEMYNEAQESFYKQQEQEDSEKAKALHADILEHTKDRQLSDTVVTPEGKLEGTSFNASVKEKKPKAYSMKGMRRLAVAALAPILSMLPLHSKAGGTEKGGDKDKEPAKTETVATHITNEQRLALTDTVRHDWDNYVHWIKDKKTETDPRMNTKVFADKMIEEYKKTHPGTLMDKDIVPLVQEWFIEYKEWLQNKANKGEVVIEGEGELMPNLSNTDKIAGIKTLRTFPQDWERFIEEMRLKGKAPGGTSVDYLLAHKEYVKNTYMHTDKENAENKN